MHRVLLSLCASAVMATAVLGQTPQPFPRPGTATTQSAPAPQMPQQQAAAPQPAAAEPAAPSEAMLGLPVYPTAQYIASYDAGRTQRYYLFGTTASYADLVAYYRSVLKQRGNQVFVEPPTHMFEVGRFRDETMAFPPGVTIKDWTWGGSAGYPNPRPNAEISRYPTIIMIVPAPTVAAR